MKFSEDGRFIMAWGRTGARPGEFNQPHTIALDSRGRVFVGDRSNSRIQVFDADGTFIVEWTQFGRPSGMFVDDDDMLYVTDSTSNSRNNPCWKRGIYIGSARDGSVTAFIPDPDLHQQEQNRISGHLVSPRISRAASTRPTLARTGCGNTSSHNLDRLRSPTRRFSPRSPR